MDSKLVDLEERRGDNSVKLEDSQSQSDSSKAIPFIPVIKSEGRAKMCALKTGDSKQKEMLQKLKNKEAMALRPKAQDSKLPVEQSSKAESSTTAGKEKLRGNMSILSALKTPLSQVLRKSIEASEMKEKGQLASEKLQHASERIPTRTEKSQSVSDKINSHVENMKIERLDNSSSEYLTEEPVISQRAKKSFSEGEGGMSLRQTAKTPSHSAKAFPSLRSSTGLKRTVEKPAPNGKKRAVVVSEPIEALTSKANTGSKSSTQSRTATSSPTEDSGMENSTSSNQGGNSSVKKKNRKRHFKGATYGLYLTKKKKKKQKSNDESKDDECSLAGTENSSYLDSEDENSLVSEDFYTPSEKSLADEEHGTDSRNSPMLSVSEQKNSNSDSLLPEGQDENSENCMQNLKNEDNVSPMVTADECDEISQNTAGILQQLSEIQWEPDTKFIDEKFDEEQSSYASVPLKAPQYDEISNESFSNSTLFPFKESPVENVKSIDKDEDERDKEDSVKQDDQNSNDTLKENDIKLEEGDGDAAEEVNMAIEGNFSSMFQDDILPTSKDDDMLSAPKENLRDASPPPKKPVLENSSHTIINSVIPEDEVLATPESSPEKDDAAQKETDSSQSTIATCVKSRQRIKRRFTDDIVDTDVGLLSLNTFSEKKNRPKKDSLESDVRKALMKPDPPQDIIQNFQSTTRSEAKKGPITKIECIFNSRQQPVKECTCEGDTYEANLGKEEEGVFCQAVDSIDDKLVGCSNPVVTPRLVRPSVKIPFTIMCEMHLWRLKHHHSCPYCGLFCSQGSFMQCATKKGSKQRVIHLYHEQCQSKEEGILPFCLHCGATAGLKRVQLEMHMASPPAFFLSQLPSAESLPVVSKARITLSSASEFLKREEEELSDNAYKIEKTGKILSSAGLPGSPEKEDLDRLLKVLNEESAECIGYNPDQFYTFASQGDVLKLLHMLACGFDPNYKFPNQERETALHAAAAGGHLTIVHLLIQAGAIHDSFNERIYTPLMLAVENNHKEVVHYLVKKGALVDFKCENGMSSLHLAAKSGNLDILKILMTSREVDLNAQDDGGWTPIVWASEHDHYNVVKYLLKRGANPNIKDNEGNTGLHWSAFSGSVDICYLYLDYGCDINAINELGDTPLHIAARQDSFPCVTLFLSRGADVQIVNKANQLPADCCLDKNSDTYLSLSLNLLLRKITAKYKHKAEKIIHRDISRGKEQIAIQCVNAVDDEPPPLDFLYVTENCETMPIKIDRTITSLQSCHCEDDCSTPSCSCSSISYQCWYDKEGLLLPDFNLLDPPMLFECNRACSCWSLNCHNRVLQNGITCRLQLIRTKGKGWGVRTLKDVPKGAFICEYVGELISDSAADKRADDSYLFDLDNRDGETYCLDARYYGNISRFINHLCDPNLVPVKIYVDHQDLNFPRIAFFSSREIKQYEELGFDYGEKFWAIKYKSFTCDCGTPKCKYSKETIHDTLANYYRRLKEEQMEENVQQPPVQPV